MDNTDDDAIYPPNRYDLGQGYGSSQHPKPSVTCVSNFQRVDDDDVVNNGDSYDDDEDIEDFEDDDDYDNVVEEIKSNDQMKGVVIGVDNDEGYEDDYSGDGDDTHNGFKSRKIQDVTLERHQKKRKLESLLSNYEFAPRMVASSSTLKPPSHGGRNSVTDWTEHETFVLLDAWGKRFLKHGRKSVRSEEWQAVAEKVSESSKITRTDTQCRNRLDTLKKKYKKEKVELAENQGTTSKWVYFRKMDMLMSSPLHPTNGYVSVNPKVYPVRVNSMGEVRDSLGDSEFTRGESDDLNDFPPKRLRGEGDSFKLLADSIDKFSVMYEKIETRKRQQLVEFEKMRMDFQRDLEMEKRKILEQAQVEFAKIWQDNREDNSLSADNVSG